MVKRFISSNASEILNMTAPELKQSIKASEGRVILSDNVSFKESYIGYVTNAEIALSFGADLILLNGIDIRKYAFEEYVQIFSVVFQDFKLMEMPLGENLATSANVDEQKAMRVLEEVGLSARVAGMEKGLKTQLGKENGEGILLSGGEAQKAAIARALYKDAPVVILDEPTAALDPLAEAEIYENFNELVKDKTSIFISHRMSSCKFCDEIVVFDHGQIVQRGTHDQLAGQPGLYQELWEAQAQYYRHSPQTLEMIGSQV